MAAAISRCSPATLAGAYASATRSAAAHWLAARYICSAASGRRALRNTDSAALSCPESASAWALGRHA